MWHRTQMRAKMNSIIEKTDRMEELTLEEEEMEWEPIHLEEEDNSEQEIKRALPEVIVSLNVVSIKVEEVAQNLSCAVCQLEYKEGDNVTELPGSHKFHPGCIRTWLEMHATCPICRYVLPN